MLPKATSGGRPGCRFAGRCHGGSGGVSDGKNHGRTLLDPAFLPVDAGCRRIDAEKKSPCRHSLAIPMLPFIPPSYGPASSLWAGWRAFWALAADFWLCRRWFGFSAFRWLKQWQPHWWSWRPWGYRPAPATPCPERYRSRLRAGSSSAAFWGRGGGGARRASENARTLSMCSMPSCCWRWPCICYLKAYETEGKTCASAFTTLNSPFRARLKRVISRRCLNRATALSSTIGRTRSRGVS